MSPDAPPVQTTTFEFQHLVVTKAIYELLAGGAPIATERPPVVNVAFEIAASAKVSKDGRAAFIGLETKILPDQQWQPYRIEVNLGAAFASNTSSFEELLTFCRVNAPSILFPYIRETVHRLTADAPHGPVRLNPINISQLLNQTDWDISETANADSTEPPPPSEQ